MMLLKIAEEPADEFGLIGSLSVSECLRKSECTASMLDAMAHVAEECGDRELAAELADRSRRQRALAAQVRETCR